MKIYIVIWEDRHTDVTVQPFDDAQKAIDAARKTASLCCRHEQDYEERDYGRYAECLFYARYSRDSCIRVVETELLR